MEAALERFVQLGRFVKPIGLKGEMKLLESADFWPEVLRSEVLELRHEGRQMAVRILRYRTHSSGKFAVVLQGVVDRTTAEAHVGAELWLDTEKLDVDLPGRLRPFQVRGFTAMLPDGQTLGEVKDLQRMPAQDLLIVQGPEKDYRIPFVEPFVDEFDTAAGTLKIHPVPGLLEL